ncbi:MAG: prepilin-type N-terminal cleavage/methylation domain-containing protein [Planctomycetota bacterium]|nr:prepilin-type N-terminal cleavage/methylation domain-containing protein [Planctomycetota bacterium]MDW8373510.1 prepilin-type N-terminal cleavage/methylation domain-containing protein [Planctomycetota bacterium]
MQRGFTLIELLAACGVFLFGFAAAIGLMTVGTRARAQADGLLRLGLAASSLPVEFALDAWLAEDPQQSPPPSAYRGDGQAEVAMPGEAQEDLDAPLYPYRPQPGIWYRVLRASDARGGDDRAAAVLRFELLVVWNPVPDETLTLRELAQRHRLDRRPDWEGGDHLAMLIEYLTARGLAVRETHWVIRRPRMPEGGGHGG